MAPRPPERIEIGTEAVAVRPRAHHADVLAEAIGASLDHLRPWMAWATPGSASAGFQRQRLADGEPAWDAGEDHPLLLLDPTEAVVLGGSGLHRRRGPGVLEIGYWLRPEATGRGLMTRVVAVLTEVALGVDGIHEVQIRCDVANTASAGVPRRLGYELREVVDKEPEAPAETGRHQVWVTRGPASG